MRAAAVTRKTRETKVTVSLNLDGRGASTSRTGIPFLDHMLILFGTHGGLGLSVRAQGDLEVDVHHTNEDVGIVLGEAFRKALDVYSGMNAVTLIQITQRNLGRVEELLERLRGKSVPKLRWEAEEAEKEKGVTGKSPPPPFPEAETARE